MREKDRKLLRRKLDVEMRPFRRALLVKEPTNGLLRAVRLSLRIPVAEIAGTMGVNRSSIQDMEAREERGGITLGTMARVADAMGCEVVYGVVPKGSKTMEELMEERLWVAVLGVPLLNKVERERIAAAGARGTEGERD
jgi:transcriptional regulator with XRE-family HTH domain